MDKKWKDTFHFTQRERKGVFILFSILIGLLILRKQLQQSYTTPITDSSAFKRAIAEFEAERIAATPLKIQPKLFPFNPNTIDKKGLLALGIPLAISERIIKYRQKGGSFKKKKDLQKIYGLDKSTYRRLEAYIRLPLAQPKTTTVTRKSITLHPFVFDPNTVTFAQLIQMGLSKKTAQQIRNYREKGGRFQQKDDFKKIYSLADWQYKQLAPFIKIVRPKQAPSKALAFKEVPNNPNTFRQEVAVKIDINQATLKDWQRLKGIGPYYAKKIMRFRDKLGGFTSIPQIGTTYDLPDSVFQKIQPHLIQSPITRPLTINSSGIEELSFHPYITKRQATVLINYRKNHGAFKKWEDLRKVKVLSELELSRLQPYLRY